MENELLHARKSEVLSCMASCIEWHLPVQEEADWLRLSLFKNEVENITKLFFYFKTLLLK